MAGLTTRTYKDSYKNVVILGDAAWTGVQSTLTFLKDGNGTELPLAVSADALKVKSGKLLYFGDSGDVNIYNPDANTLKISAPKIQMYGKVVNPAGAPISAVSIIGTGANITTIRGTAVSGFTRIKGTTISGTTLKSGSTKVTSGGVSTESMTVGVLNVGANGIKMSDSGKILTSGGTGIFSVSPGQLQFNIASVGKMVMVASKFTPKENEVMKLGETGYRFDSVHTKSVFALNLFASNADIKTGNFLGTLVSATWMKTPTANVSTLTNKTFNGVNVNGTKLVFTTASAGYFKGANMGLTGNASVNNLEIGGEVLLAKSLPTASAGLATGQLYASGVYIKIKH